MSNYYILLGFVFRDHRNSHKKDGSKFKHYYAYGADVVSVGDGKVVSIINTIEESDVLLQSDDSDEHWMKVKSLQNVRLSNFLSTSRNITKGTDLAKCLLTFCLIFTNYNLRNVVIQIYHF